MRIVSLLCFVHSDLEFSWTAFGLCFGQCHCCKWYLIIAIVDNWLLPQLIFLLFRSSQAKFLHGYWWSSQSFFVFPYKISFRNNVISLTLIHLFLFSCKVSGNVFKSRCNQRTCILFLKLQWNSINFSFTINNNIHGKF